MYSEQRKRREADSEGVGEETQSLTVEHLSSFTNYTWEVVAVSGLGGQGQEYLWFRFQGQCGKEQIC